VSVTLVVVPSVGVLPLPELDMSINRLCGLIHEDNVKAGWWEDGFGKLNIATKLALVHSEVSEALEGVRKDLMDEKLPHRPAVEVELADTCIRIFDLCGALGLDLEGAIFEKMAYNAERNDHKPEVRAGENGKKF